MVSDEKFKKISVLYVKNRKSRFFHGLQAVRPNFKVWVLTFFIAFKLDSILNKQKNIKKIAFLVKMAKIASFSNFQLRGQNLKKKKYTEILRKYQILRKSWVEVRFRKKSFFNPL
jgi:hypothetical protein